METKICYKCGRVLEASETYFYKYPKNKDGLGTRCKECLGQKFKVKIKAKEGFKICSSCHGEFPNTSKYFYKKNKKGDLQAICKECKYERSERKYKHSVQSPEQREKIKKYMKEYYKNHKNKEAYKKSKKKWQEENKEKFRESKSRWRKEHRERCNTMNQKCLAKKRRLPSTLTIEQWEEIKQHFNNRCAYCGKELPLEQEHFIPLIKGGEYTANNIVCACRGCNSSKRSKDFKEWYSKYKYYSKEREKAILDFLGYKNNKQQLSLII